MLEARASCGRTRSQVHFQALLSADAAQLGCPATELVELPPSDGPRHAQPDDSGARRRLGEVVMILRRAPSTTQGGAWRVARLALLALIAYVLSVYIFVGLLYAAPSAQALIVCMQWVKHFLRADYALPASEMVLGARNVRLRSGDVVELGMWQILPTDAPEALTAGVGAAAGGEAAVKASELFDAALARAEDVILFLHGNGEHRAVQQGPIHARALSASLSAHVLIPDYRGFGDSSGWPTEAGLYEDAHAAWDWLAERGVPPSHVLIWGHSLGSAVAMQLAADLAERAAQDGSDGPLGLVLESAFTSLPELLPDYPLGRAICWLPGVRAAAQAALVFRMDSVAQLRRLVGSAPGLQVLLLHGAMDTTVPISHSRALLRAGRAAGAQRLELLELPQADHHTVLAHDAALLAVAQLLAGAHGELSGENAEGSTRGGHAASPRVSRSQRP